ncbi:serine/threonine protein kinase [Micromonospora sp. KC213]|uniref:serine/threonine protein kinase n=1 Tax=Micromonospora sp. KC213 TaxID=2530378 RepID=UPI0010503C05|nr:serine/threonine protein kinase [Micromonospora sp. KC213]TDC42858.1 serine/threonine protein kinase [Micromonospora sp. KC213]
MRPGAVPPAVLTYEAGLAAPYVVVQLDGSSQPRRESRPRHTVRLRPGHGVEFGFRRQSRAIALAGPDVQLVPVAGRITAAANHWSVTNFSAEYSYLVENLDDGGEYVRVHPGRDCAPIPFERSSLVLPGNCGPQSITVLVFGASRVDPTRMMPPVRFRCGGLDIRRKYFLVLVALCEPRLLSGWHAGVPSVPEVMERLRPLVGWGSVSRNAINYHIDYLAGEKLHNYLGANVSPNRVRWKREALVSVALRHGLVRPEHLSLLPPRLDGSVEVSRLPSWCAGDA